MELSNKQRVYFSLASSFVLLLICLMSAKSDWFISQTLADVYFLSMKTQGFYPYYSFLVGRGYYFLQDPQSILFSPSLLTVPLFGPALGIRLTVFLLAFCGTFSLIIWLEKYVSSKAAVFGATAWALSAGVFWRFAIGNDMFAWHFFAPTLMLGLDFLIAKLNMKSVIFFAAALSIFALGPTLHSTLYFVGPILLFYFLFKMKDVFKFGKAPKLFLLLAVVFALVIAATLIKLYGWYLFRNDFDRVTVSDGVARFGSLIFSLIDFFTTSHDYIPMSSYGEVPSYGNEEFLSALNPVALGLAVWSVFKIKSVYGRYRDLIFLAAFCILFGSLMAANQTMWNLFRELTHGIFRVSPRYIMLVSFGVLILSVIGYDVFIKTEKSKKWILNFNFIFAGIWILSAAYTNTLSRGLISLETQTPTSFESTDCMRFGYRSLLEGKIWRNSFLIVGNNFDLPCGGEVESISPRLTVKVDSILIRNLLPGESHAVNFHLPSKGFEILEDGHQGTAVQVASRPDSFTLINSSEEAIREVALRPRYPIPFVVAITSALTIIFFIVAGLHLALKRNASGS